MIITIKLLNSQKVQFQNKIKHLQSAKRTLKTILNNSFNSNGDCQISRKARIEFRKSEGTQHLVSSIRNLKHGVKDLEQAIRLINANVKLMQRTK